MMLFPLRNFIYFGEYIEIYWFHQSPPQICGKPICFRKYFDIGSVDITYQIMPYDISPDHQYFPRIIMSGKYGNDPIWIFLHLIVYFIPLIEHSFPPCLLYPYPLWSINLLPCFIYHSCPCNTQHRYIHCNTYNTVLGLQTSPILCVVYFNNIPDVCGGIIMIFWCLWGIIDKFLHQSHMAHIRPICTCCII